MRMGGRVRAMAGALAAMVALIAPAAAHALTPPARIAAVATHPWRLEAHSVTPLIGMEDPLARERTFAMMERAGIRQARVDLKWSEVEPSRGGLRDWSHF